MSINNHLSAVDYWSFALCNTVFISNKGGRYENWSVGENSLYYHENLFVLLPFILRDLDRAEVQLRLEKKSLAWCGSNNAEPSH